MDRYRIGNTWVSNNMYKMALGIVINWKLNTSHHFYVALLSKSQRSFRCSKNKNNHNSAKVK